MRFSVLAALAVMFCWVPVAHSAPSKAQLETAFQRYLQKEFWPLAKAHGISWPVFHKHLSKQRINWSLPDLIIPGRPPDKNQYQAEFSAPEKYFVTQNFIILRNIGQKKLQQNRNLFDSIEKRYGVPAEIIAAIWGRESAYGAAYAHFNAFNVLATKAFLSKRKDMFRDELLAALVIVENNHIASHTLKSSWAGALGQPQFMPSSYLRYGVDFDGDGTVNIWTSIPDTLASIAHYLQAKGWHSGLQWGNEVVVPENLSCSYEGHEHAQKTSDWAKLGVTLANGQEFLRADDDTIVSLLMPAGRFGPAFMVSNNFTALKSYNKSDLYAVFIGHLADQLQGKDGFQQKWHKTDPILRSDIIFIQQVLQQQGFYDDQADGFIGARTRRAIGLWQRKNGLAETCFPEKTFVNTIRQRENTQ